MAVLFHLLTIPFIVASLAPSVVAALLEDAPCKTATRHPVHIVAASGPVVMAVPADSAPASPPPPPQFVK